MTAGSSRAEEDASCRCDRDTVAENMATPGCPVHAPVTDPQEREARLTHNARRFLDTLRRLDEEHGGTTTNALVAHDAGLGVNEMRAAIRELVAAGLIEDGP